MHNIDFSQDKEVLKTAWEVLFFEAPPKDATWDRWFKSYGRFAPRMIREMLLSLAAKYAKDRERNDAVKLENFASSILSRIDRERSETLKKLKSDLATMPTFDQLGDPRGVLAGQGEQENRWNR